MPTPTFSLKNLCHACHVDGKLTAVTHLVQWEADRVQVCAGCRNDWATWATESNETIIVTRVPRGDCCHYDIEDLPHLGMLLFTEQGAENSYFIVLSTGQRGFVKAGY